MLFYHLSKNPGVQEQILEELNGLMGPMDDPTVEMINSEQGQGMGEIRIVVTHHL